MKLEESRLVKDEKDLVHSMKSDEDVSDTEQCERRKKVETESDYAEVGKVDKMEHSGCSEKVLAEEAEPVEDSAVYRQESTPEKVREEATPKKTLVKKVHSFFCKLSWLCVCVCVCVFAE